MDENTEDRTMWIISTAMIYLAGIVCITSLVFGITLGIHLFTADRIEISNGNCYDHYNHRILNEEIRCKKTISCNGWPESFDDEECERRK